MGSMTRIFNSYSTSASREDGNVYVCETKGLALLMRIAGHPIDALSFHTCLLQRGNPTLFSIYIMHHILLSTYVRENYSKLQFVLRNWSEYTNDCTVRDAKTRDLVHESSEE